MSFTTVYDIMQQNVDYSLAKKSFIFFIVGILSILFTKGKRNENRTYKKYFYLGIAFVIFSILWMFSIGGIEYTARHSGMNAMIDKKYEIIEGQVENYEPMLHSGHANEKFDVNKVHFEYSDFELGGIGYHNAASYGGVVREGLNVRITYLPVDSINPILKLEIAK